MSKIICDICGTVYQDTAEACPICGYSHKSGAEEDLLADSPLLERGKNNTAPPTPKPQKHKEIFDFDEVNPPDYQEQSFDDGDDDSDDDGHRTNVLLVVLLVTIITLLLAATAFLFFRFYLPNANSQPPQTENPQVTEADHQEIPETTERVIPCQNLALTSGVTELTREGQLWLLHVTVLPEDTTDQLIFRAEDESVVTVSEGGRLTAIGEGETYVYITCGEKEIKCKVVVRFTEETQPSEETLPEETGAEFQDISDVPGQTEPETTAATEPTEAVILKLKQSDVSSSKRGVSFDLELDCDLKPEDVTWLTLDSRVAIVKNGTVTTIGPGSTKIVAEYKGQQAVCIVRCVF